jgi:hypothetical protein
MVMGDRANVVVVETVRDDSPREAVFLYTHWDGSELPAVVKAALERGEDRRGDAPYLARVVFNAMTKQSASGTTGYGISTRLTDNEHPLLVLDVERQVVVEYPESVYNEHGFARLGSYKGVPFAKYTGKWRRA